jgi:hypothetical protein
MLTTWNQKWRRAHHGLLAAKRRPMPLQSSFGRFKCSAIKKKTPNQVLPHHFFLNHEVPFALTDDGTAQHVCCQLPTTYPTSTYCMCHSQVASAARDGYRSTSSCNHFPSFRSSWKLRSSLPLPNFCKHTRHACPGLNHSPERYEVSQLRKREHTVCHSETLAYFRRLHGATKVQEASNTHEWSWFISSVTESWSLLRQARLYEYYV